MHKLVVVYWRDIPAQVIVGRGRKAAKHPLPERFEQAIDRAAMKAGMAGSDDYLGEWRKGPAKDVEGEPDAIAAAEAARIDAEYDRARLIALINAEGRA